jgi:hypothetical protein
MQRARREITKTSDTPKSSGDYIYFAVLAGTLPVALAACGSFLLIYGSLGKIWSIIQRTAVAMARWFNLLRCFSPVPQR